MSNFKCQRRYLKETQRRIEYDEKNQLNQFNIFEKILFVQMTPSLHFEQYGIVLDANSFLQYLPTSYIF